MSNEVNILENENELAGPVSTHRQLRTSAEAKNFMLAGKAIFTLVSKRTGTRYTYKVTHKDANGQYGESWMVSYLTGQDNEGDYTYLGQIHRDAVKGFFFHATKASKHMVAALPFTGFNWAFERINAGIDVSEKMEVWHAGRCGRCGRLLTVPSSIEMGLGPECASKGF